MCYNISYLEKRAERVTKHYGAEFKPETRQLEIFHVSGFVHTRLMVITQEEPDWIQEYTWGLIPAWCRDEKQAAEMMNRTLNAVGETAFEKPSFRNSIAKKRCLVIASGFYEWHTIGKKKFPFYVSLKERPFFSLGGIYEHWVNKETGELKNTFSIITTKANLLLEKIHNTKKRMPLILPAEKEKEWINPVLSKDAVLKIMQPFDEAHMQAHSISKLITDRSRNSNVPEVQHPFTYSELEGLGI